MLAALLRRDLRLRCGLHPPSRCSSGRVVSISSSRPRASQSRPIASMFIWRNRSNTPPLVVEDRISLKLRTSVIVQVEVRANETDVRRVVVGLTQRAVVFLC